MTTVPLSSEAFNNTALDSVDNNTTASEGKEVIAATTIYYYLFYK